MPGPDCQLLEVNITEVYQDIVIYDNGIGTNVLSFIESSISLHSKFKVIFETR